MIQRAVAVASSLSRGAREEWGPLVFVPLLTPAYVVLLLLFGGQVRSEHWVLALALPVVGFAGARGAAFLRDVYPWFLVITVYDFVRYLRASWVHADAVLGCSLRDAELRVFGVAPGVTPADWLVAHQRLGLDLFFAIPYGVFVYLALGYASYLYFKDRPRMRHFLWSFAVANFIAYGLWLLVPAAPPWYLRSHGCTIDIAARPSEAAALARVDSLLGIDYFHAFYSRASSVFGAVPSMHAAYPMLGLLTAWKHSGWRTRPLHLFYVAWMASAALYLDHHWALDVIAGWLVAAVAVLATQPWLGALHPAGLQGSGVEGGRRRSSARPLSLTRAGVGRLLVLVLVGLAVVALRKQLPAAARGVVQAHPVALLALPLFFAWNQVATLAWRALLRAAGARPSALRELVRVRVEGQAVNQLVPAAGLAGEALRAVRVAGTEGVGPAALATVLDNVAGTIAGLAFALPVGMVGLGLKARAFRNELGAGLFASGLALVLLLAAVALPFQLAPRWLPRLPSTSRLRTVIAPFADRKVAVRRAFSHAVALRFVERVIAVGEVYVLFHAVGAKVSVADATLVSAVLVIVSLTVFFVPGQLGASEAATAAASSLLGYPAALGLSAALLRRARQLVVCVLGLGSLALRRHVADGGGPPAAMEEAP
jgi:inositol phosphorylceramide synthase catalytic subunit